MQGVRAQLSRDTQAQQISPTAGDMGLVPGDLKRGAHDAGQAQLAAGPVVVAHFHRAGETAPGRPVQPGLELLGLIARFEAEQPAVVHFRRRYNLARIEQPLGIKDLLHLGKIIHHALAEHGQMELGSN